MIKRARVHRIFELLIPTTSQTPNFSFVGKTCEGRRDYVVGVNNNNNIGCIICNAYICVYICVYIYIYIQWVVTFEWGTVKRATLDFKVGRNIRDAVSKSGEGGDYKSGKVLFSREKLAHKARTHTCVLGSVFGSWLQISYTEVWSRSPKVFFVSAFPRRRE